MDKPSLDSFVSSSNGSQGGRPSLDNFTAKPYDSSQNINNSAAILGVTNNINANIVPQRDETGQTSQDSLQAMQSQDQQGIDQANQANSTGGIVSETAKGTASSLGNSAIKFLGSAVRAPIDIVRGLFGKAPLQGGMTDFSGNPMNSIQSDFQGNADKIASGDPNAPTPLQATGQAVGQTVGGAADVLGAAEGLGAAKNLAQRTVGDYLGGKELSAYGKSALEQTIKDVSPRLTPEVASTVPTKTSGILKKISVVPDQSTIETANVVHDIISKGKTFSDKANLADNAIVKEATTLKADIASVDHPIPKQELVSALQKTERPDLVASDPTLSNALDRVVSRATRIISDMKGTVSGALDGRQAFDQAVKQQFPKLYDGSSNMTATKEAIKNLRSTWNDFIEGQLPDDESFRESLDKQSKLFDARDTLREKAALGAPTVQGEIGTNRVGRFANNHPIITKGAKIAAGSAVGATGAGAVYEGGKKILGQ